MNVHSETGMNRPRVGDGMGWGGMMGEDPLTRKCSRVGEWQSLTQGVLAKVRLVNIQVAVPPCAL